LVHAEVITKSFWRSFSTFHLFYKTLADFPLASASAARQHEVVSDPYDPLLLFDRILRLAVEAGASDVHVKSASPAHLRVNGKIEPVEMDKLTSAQIYAFVNATVPRQVASAWREDMQADYSYEASGIGRFRVSAFHQRGVPGMVFRHVKDNPPTFAELNHESAIFEKLCGERDGIVLVCGPTGSGKSSTLAAMLDWINHRHQRHIVTLEDPIEFNYEDDKSIFNQREVGIDTPSFALGMKAVLRQDPDIILVGEMRDRETFETALGAAETGHMVYGTLHSASAQQAVQRLFEFFPQEMHHGMRRQIAGALRATITQMLVPRLEGGGRVPVVEVFAVDAVGKKTIEDGDFEKIPQVLEAGSQSGSRTFNADLYRLVKAGIVAKNDALAVSPNPRALEMNLKGIFLSSGGIVA
jgi:twitching motility protein PilT